MQLARTVVQQPAVDPCCCCCPVNDHHDSTQVNTAMTAAALLRPAHLITLTTAKHQATGQKRKTSAQQLTSCRLKVQPTWHQLHALPCMQLWLITFSASGPAFDADHSGDQRNPTWVQDNRNAPIPVLIHNPHTNVHQARCRTAATMQAGPCKACVC